jgi:hypothetical protein
MIFKELWVDYEESFKAFTSYQYPGADTDYWSKLKISLQALTHVRDMAVHPEARGDTSERGVRKPIR